MAYDRHCLWRAGFRWIVAYLIFSMIFNGLSGRSIELGGKNIFWIFFESQQEDSQKKWLVNATFVSFVYTFEGIKLNYIDFCF